MVNNAGPAALIDRPKQQATSEACRDCVDAGGLADRLNHLPKQLSGGQEQRVAIARAIVSAPVLLLADEPTGDLDSRSALEIIQLIRQLNRKFRKTVVLVTHDPQAASFASHTYHLEKGCLLQSA